MNSFQVRFVWHVDIIIIKIIIIIIIKAARLLPSRKGAEVSETGRGMGCVGKDREILCQEYSILIKYSYVGGWDTLKDESAREKSKPNLKPAKKQTQDY